MNITGVIPQKEVYFPTKETDLKKAVAKFYDQNHDAEITSIDGRNVVGICEECELPIFEDESYQRDDYGIYWHYKSA